MTINRKTFVANIRRAISDGETVTIGGGHFTDNDMRDLLALISPAAGSPVARAMCETFPAKPVAPEEELSRYGDVRRAWADLAGTIQNDEPPAMAVEALATHIQCLHADALSIRRVSGSQAETIKRQDVAAMRLNDQLADAESRLDHCCLIAKIRDGKPVAFLRSNLDTWKEASHSAPYDARARIMAGETVCNSTAQFRLATGEELHGRIVALETRADELGELHTAATRTAQNNLDSANALEARAERAEAAAKVAAERELVAFTAARRIMDELSGLTLGMLPSGAYGGALADAYCEVRKTLAL